MNEFKSEFCELAEVIYDKPLSGAFEEVSFGSDKGNTLWVKFSDKDGVNEWIGRFGDSGAGARRVEKIAEPDKFFIAAGCSVYLLDATDRKLLKQYHASNACEITYDKQRESLIVADWTRLCGLEFDGKKLFSQKIAVDGIRDLKIEGGILSGLAFRDYGDEKEERFWFDLDKLKILRWEKIISKNPAGKKSCWKFW